MTVKHYWSNNSSPHTQDRLMQNGMRVALIPVNKQMPGALYATPLEAAILELNDRQAEQLDHGQANT